MKKSLILNAGFILLLCANYAAAQAPISTPYPTPVRNINDARDLPRRPAEIQKDNILQQRRYIRLDREKDPTLSPFEISETALAKLEITKAEKAAFKDDVKNNLRILKVFSAPACAANKFLIDARDEKCAEIADLIRISYYSFLMRFHGEYRGDFRIVEDDLIAGNGKYIHGMLVDLGEIESGKIDNKTPQVKKLADFPIALNVQDETKQRQELQTGFTYRDLKISASQKLVKNRVYLMRLVSYSFKDSRKTDYNKDSMFLFKVGDLTEDKMTVILWKKLSEKEAPRLKIK